MIYLSSAYLAFWIPVGMLVTCLECCQLLMLVLIIGLLVFCFVWVLQSWQDELLPFGLLVAFLACLFTATAGFCLLAYCYAVVFGCCYWFCRFGLQIWLFSFVAFFSFFYIAVFNMIFQAFLGFFSFFWLFSCLEFVLKNIYYIRQH